MLADNIHRSIRAFPECEKKREAYGERVICVHGNIAVCRFIVTGDLDNCTCCNIINIFK